MSFSLSANVPSEIEVTIQVTDPVTSLQWSSIVTATIVDQAVEYANTSLKNVLGNSQFTVPQQRLAFAGFIDLLFPTQDAATIKNTYNTPTQMLTFMDFIGSTFNLYSQDLSETIFSWEQQFADTGAALGVGPTTNMFTEVA